MVHGYRWTILCIALVILFVASACSHGGYEVGDGKDSYVQADFVEAYTASDNAVYSAVTDEGDSLLLAPQLKVSWIKQANAKVRGLLYYNKVVDSSTEGLRLVAVPVVDWHPTTWFRSLHVDPITFESAWISKNNRYLNIGFSVLTGEQTSEMKGQTLGLIATDSLVVGGKLRRIDLTLYHDQGGVPQYYSSRGYISVPLTRLPSGCLINLRINSYKGVIFKTFKK